MAESTSDSDRAAAWSTIGTALVVIGVAGAGSLTTAGVSSHLWGDDSFLAGFALACLLTALGVYVLLAEFIGEIWRVRLPLPLTRREREARRQGRTHARRPISGVSAPRRRLEAHAKRGKALLARADEKRQILPLVRPWNPSIDDATIKEIAAFAPTRKRQWEELRREMDTWLATAETLVKETAPNLLAEYQSDHAPDPLTTGMRFPGFPVEELLRQRVAGLQRVIDAMDDA